MNQREQFLRDVAAMKPQCACGPCASKTLHIGLQHVGYGHGPASISAFEFVHAAGVSRLVSIVMDDGLLREVVLPAILDHLQKRDEAGAAAEAEGEARAARIREERS